MQRNIVAQLICDFLNKSERLIAHVGDTSVMILDIRLIQSMLKIKNGGR